MAYVLHHHAVRCYDKLTAGTNIKARGRDSITVPYNVTIKELYLYLSLLCHTITVADQSPPS